MVKRGEIWLAALDPTVWTEIRKTRPCLIVSPDDLNASLRRVVIAPLTSGSHPAPFRVPVNFRRRPGLILLDQIRTIDKKRLQTRMGNVDDATLGSTLSVLRNLFGA